jgi:hypothetical protein
MLQASARRATALPLSPTTAGCSARICSASTRCRGSGCRRAHRRCVGVRCARTSLLTSSISHNLSGYGASLGGLDPRRGCTGLSHKEAGPEGPGPILFRFTYRRSAGPRPGGGKASDGLPGDLIVAARPDGWLTYRRDGLVGRSSEKSQLKDRASRDGPDVTLKEAALPLGFVSKEGFDLVVDPSKMVRPYVEACG